ncbi:MAG: CopG family transcriptional regulator [Armatimonadota bacterium]
MKTSAEMAATNIRLRRAQLKQLKRLAVEREMSLSRLVREALDEFIAQQYTLLSPVAYRNDSLFGVGKKPGRSGLGDLAEHHNKYLYRDGT